MPPLAGERWWCQPPKVDSPSPAGRLYGFRRQRRHLYWRPKGRRTSPARRYYIPSEGGALNPSGRHQPVPDRTLGAQGRQARRRPQPSPAGRQPSGIQLPADSSQKPITSNVAHSKKALTITVSAFSVNQQLPILPGRFQPSTFGVCELNYRVRHGYGCILTAIATESLRVCSLKTA